MKQVERWLVFSDLHVQEKTIDTCLEVLTGVYQHAKTLGEQTGILFLGDFWHTCHLRGNLPIQLCNTIIRLFHDLEWNLPTILIPGNHDQVRDCFHLNLIKDFFVLTILDRQYWRAWSISYY